MKRVLLVAAVLAAMLAQPAGAWIPLGQTSGPYYQPSGVLVKKDFSYAKTDTGDNPGIWPVFFFDYQAQVEAELVANGFDHLGYAVFHLTMESTSASPWKGWWGLWYGQIATGPYYLVKGTWSVDQFTPSSDGTVNFAANLLSDGLVSIPINWLDSDSSNDTVVTKPLSAYGMTNEFRLTGTLVKQTYDEGYSGWDGEHFDYYRGPMTLSVKPIPEPVFFQMGALMGLSGLGLLRLRRKA